MEQLQQTKQKCSIVFIILKIEEGLSEHNIDTDELGDAYEYLIAQFASNSGKKAAEFYTPQRVSTILAKIVTLDSADPTKGKRHHIAKVYDPTCGSGSLLFNVYQEMNKNIGEIHGQEKNLTTYNLARMNLLLHHIPYSKFHIQHGDTLTNNKLENLKTIESVLTPLLQILRFHYVGNRLLSTVMIGLEGIHFLQRVQRILRLYCI